MGTLHTETSERPVDALLAAYATGNLSVPLNALVASHLTLNPVNRDYVAALETLCGMAIDEVAAAPISKRDEKLAAIFALGDEGDEPPPMPDPVLPAPLVRLLGHGFDKVVWRSVMPGLKEFRISPEASLLWIGAGRKMPNHTHEGTEATLVLKGSFSDLTGEYRRGDIAVGDEDLDHRPVAGSEEDCICFVVNEAPLRLTGPVGRIIEMFRRH